MKRVLLTVVVWAIAHCAVAQTARPSPQLPDKVYMSLDAPVQAQMPTADRVYFAGWTFNCNGSQPTDVVLKVWSTFDGGGWKVWPIKLTRGIHRPDVSAHYRRAGSGCRVSDYTGFHLYPTKTLPLGAVAYTIEVMSPALGAGVFDRFIIVR